jgi:hypothetical protein
MVGDNLLVISPASDCRSPKLDLRVLGRRTAGRRAHLFDPVVLVNSDLTGNWELWFVLRFPGGPILSALFTAVVALFRSRAALQLENLGLRHQL